MSASDCLRLPSRLPPTATDCPSLPQAASCEQGAGYMIHEGGRWSDVHANWLFMPRKLSREVYDEIKDASKCVNLMMACPDPPAADGTDVAMQEYLEFADLRGCSDFLFVPGRCDELCSSDSPQAPLGLPPCSPRTPPMLPSDSHVTSTVS